MTARAEWYRVRAADCEAMAKDAPDVTSKSVLEAMATTWRRLAELVERWKLPSCTESESQTQ
jgi:hypothetical protein